MLDVVETLKHPRARPTDRRADADSVKEQRRFARGEGFDEQPLPRLDSEALEFRADSESFAPSASTPRRDSETMRLRSG